ncbi:hypothetical protein [Hymenobacter sp. GOD-10R]|uniref:hypothetical protein n=1 Tax=Hymenobacter sp. GOD-10R TaxID=3093922 RepID=UPI002D790CEB|nr:hypothetical protein [Hymenobacter sp. GOD-10R]WRQ28323.1 hypothetical protein SD425_24960 [Hymenobacter sp. GOD-10R]
MPVFNFSARTPWSWLLWLLFVLEVLFFTFWRKSLGPYWSPVFLYAVELLLCLLLARRLLGVRLQVAPMRKVGYRFLAGAGLLATSPLLTASIIRKALVRAPIGTFSDIVPALQVYVQRFLQHETVYKSLTMFGYTFLPNYPPMQWLPFVGADLAGIDYRWWSYGGLLLGLLAYEWVLARLDLPWAEWLLKAALPVLLVHFNVIIDKPMYSLTVEGLIVGFYCLLAAGIFSNSVWMKAAGLVFCLLSRYSLALWVPLYGLLLLYENPKRGWLTTGLTIVGVVALFVPFILHDPTIFFRAQLENLDVAKSAWQQIDTSAPWLGPIHLFNGIGLAPWFYDLPGTLEERIIRLQLVHFAVCTGIVVLAGGLFWYHRHHFDPRLAALLSLKAYLATFYAFLIVPYTYLASVSLFTSLFVVLLITRKKAAFLVPIVDSQ